MNRIVLTGGPGSGKTVIAAHLARARLDHYVHVPEAATQVYAARRTRWDLLDDAGRRDVQRTIYALQVEQEARLAALHPGKTLLLDRGTVDGAAYWPGGAEDYWRELGTTAERELARYDAVVWMQSCAAVGTYDGVTSNACRHEDSEAALAAGERVARAWSQHPFFRRVDAFPTLDEKIERVEAILRSATIAPRG